MAVQIGEDSQQSDLWLTDLERGVSERFTPDRNIDLDQLWRADGSSVSGVVTTTFQVIPELVHAVLHPADLFGDNSLGNGLCGDWDRNRKDCTTTQRSRARFPEVIFDLEAE
ncbi:MAG TPA: hypothetical protein VEX68_03240 [Bryobacteraceae bacterium]|nr:hypothetical protein [Bryobacteraceae bacterium]